VICLYRRTSEYIYMLCHPVPRIRADSNKRPARRSRDRAREPKRVRKPRSYNPRMSRAMGIGSGPIQIRNSYCHYITRFAQFHVTSSPLTGVPMSHHHSRLETLSQTLGNIPRPQRTHYAKIAIVAVLLLRSRLFAPVSKLSGARAEARRREKDKRRETKAMDAVGDGVAQEGGPDPQLLYEDEDDGNASKTLLVPFRGRISKVSLHT
jgi:hypothetical protein